MIECLPGTHKVRRLIPSTTNEYIKQITLLRNEKVILLHSKISNRTYILLHTLHIYISYTYIYIYTYFKKLKLNLFPPRAPQILLLRINMQLFLMFLLDSSMNVFIYTYINIWKLFPHKNIQTYNPPFNRQLICHHVVIN